MKQLAQHLIAYPQKMYIKLTVKLPFV